MTRLASRPAKNGQRVVPRHLIFREGGDADEADASVLRVERDEREKVAYLAALEKIAEVKQRNAELFQHGGNAGQRQVRARQDDLIGVRHAAGAKSFDGIPDSFAFGGEGRRNREGHLRRHCRAWPSRFRRCAAAHRR